MITVRRRNESESEITWLEEQKEKEIERKDILHDWMLQEERKKGRKEGRKKEKKEERKKGRKEGYITWLE